MQKTTIKPAGRWQVTLPKNTALDNRINSLLTRYEGMNLTEITKLALIELDKKESEESHPIDKVLDDYYAGKIKTTKISSKKELDKYLKELNEGLES
jgi:hypothetical protein